MNMTEEKLILAIGRLERALSRAEASGDKLVQNVRSIDDVNNSNDHAYQKLDQQHKDLKKQAHESLVAIENILSQKAVS